MLTRLPIPSTKPRMSSGLPTTSNRLPRPPRPPAPASTVYRPAARLPTRNSPRSFVSAMDCCTPPGTAAPSVTRRTRTVTLALGVPDVSSTTPLTAAPLAIWTSNCVLGSRARRSTTTGAKPALDSRSEPAPDGTLISKVPSSPVSTGEALAACSVTRTRGTGWSASPVMTRPLMTTGGAAADGTLSRT